MVEAQQPFAADQSIVLGSGTPNYIPIWITNTKLNNSLLYQSSSGNVGISTTTPGSKLDVAGNINLSGSVLYHGSTLLQVPPGMYSGTNLALGLGAVAHNTTGYDNMATGSQALEWNITGHDNTASGAYGLNNNNSGSFNAANGTSALFDNNTGNYNTASGAFALQNNTSGNRNIGIGYLAGAFVIGGNSDNIHIGNLGSANDNGTIRIGNPGVQSSFFAAGVRSVATANNDAIPVVIDSNGQLGTVSSSRRFKEDINDMGGSSRDLMRLRPVTFRYQKPFADGSKPVQYGLIAEEVAEVFPDLVARSADGQIETVKYQVLDSMLLNEVQRLQAETQDLRERLARLEAAFANRAAGELGK